MSSSPQGVMKNTCKAEPQTRVESRKFLTADFINSIRPEPDVGQHFDELCPEVAAGPFQGSEPV
jgi:hypothetical protein